MGALREACIAVGREWPTVDYACSLVTARRSLDLISYRLPMVAEECGVDLVRDSPSAGRGPSCRRVVRPERARRASRSDG